MNILGFIFLLWATFITHIVLRRYNELEKNQREIIENFRASLHPGSDINYSLTNDRISDIKAANEDNNYNKISKVNYEDKNGFDIENDYDLLKLDLMKYVEDQGNKNNKTEKIKTPIYTETKNSDINNNVLKLLKKNEPEVGSDAKLSMDKIYEQKIMQNQTNKEGIKTLKPDLWTYENEAVMNGGKFGNLMPFDNSESGFMVL